MGNRVYPETGNRVSCRTQGPRSRHVVPWVMSHLTSRGVPGHVTWGPGPRSRRIYNDGVHHACNNVGSAAGNTLDFTLVVIPTIGEVTTIVTAAMGQVGTPYLSMHFMTYLSLHAFPPLHPSTLRLLPL
eukprot:2507672-Rhodomonas_salina.3